MYIIIAYISHQKYRFYTHVMIFYSEIPQSHMGNHREAKVQYLTNNTHISRYILKNFQIFTYMFFSGHTFSIFLLIFEYFTKNIQYKIIGNVPNRETHFIPNTI